MVTWTWGANHVSSMELFFGHTLVTHALYINMAICWFIFSSLSMIYTMYNCFSEALFPKEAWFVMEWHHYVVQHSSIQYIQWSVAKHSWGSASKPPWESQSSAIILPKGKKGETCKVSLNQNWCSHISKAMSQATFWKKRQNATLEYTHLVHQLDQEDAKIRLQDKEKGSYKSKRSNLALWLQIETMKHQLL